MFGVSILQSACLGAAPTAAMGAAAFDSPGAPRIQISGRRMSIIFNSSSMETLVQSYQSSTQLYGCASN